MTHRSLTITALLIVLPSLLSLAQIYDRHPIDGTDDNILFGSQLTSGNVNGDAYQDLLVGELPGSRLARFYLFPGSPTFPTGVNSSADASLVISAPGLTPNDDFFGEGNDIGDINGDGFEDILISGGDDFPTDGVTTPTEPDLGAAYVFLGSNTTNSTPDLFIRGKSLPPGTLQENLLILGIDIDAGNVIGAPSPNGIKDIIVLANRGRTGLQKSEVYIFPGSPNYADGSLTQLSADTDAATTITIDSYVRSLSVGDVNGDGYDDIIVRKRGPDADNDVAWVFYGAATLPDQIAESAADLTFNTGSGSTSGYFVGSETAGDLNGDGNDDVVFGTRETTSSGIVTDDIFVHSGDTLSSGGPTPPLQTTFPIIDRRETSLSIGQLNNGPDDLLVGSMSDPTDTAFIYYGATDFISRPIGFVPPPDVILVEDTPDENFGVTVEIVGNMNATPTQEFAVGANDNDRGGFQAGAVYLFQESGQDLPTIDLPPCLSYWAESPIGWQFCGSIFIEAFLLDVEFTGLFTRNLDCDPDNPNNAEEFIEVTSSFIIEEIQGNPDEPNNPEGTRLLITLKDGEKPFDELHFTFAPQNQNANEGFAEVSFLTNEGSFVSVGPKVLDLSVEEIKGDVDGNGVLNLADLKLLRSVLRTCDDENNFLPKADLNGDGCITFKDVWIWRRLFAQYKKENR